jgi:hypothetical protein
MADDAQVMQQVAVQNDPQLLQAAQKEYPYLADKDIAYTYTPDAGDKRYLEFWSPTETGDQQYPRPQSIPMGKVGVQVINPQTKPIDILGDYVSHYGVQADPQLQQLYQQFAGQLDPQMMQNRYAYHQANLGETRPYDQWLQATGLPEMFRGYTFNQWGDNAKQMYTPQQLQTLDAVRSYLGIK